MIDNEHQTAMYLTLFLDQRNYEFISSLHTTREAAETAFGDLLQRFIIAKGEPLPPRATWGDLFDEDTGEAPHLYEIELDGGPAEEISLSSSDSDVVATA
jgi:hypothetical protein